MPRQTLRISVDREGSRVVLALRHPGAGAVTLSASVRSFAALVAQLRAAVDSPDGWESEFETRADLELAKG